MPPRKAHRAVRQKGTLKSKSNQRYRDGGPAEDRPPFARTTNAVAQHLHNILNPTAAAANHHRPYIPPKLLTLIAQYYLSFCQSWDVSDMSSAKRAMISGFRRTVSFASASPTWGVWGRFRFNYLPPPPTLPPFGESGSGSRPIVSTSFGVRIDAVDHTVVSAGNNWGQRRGSRTGTTIDIGINRPPADRQYYKSLDSRGSAFYCIRCTATDIIRVCAGGWIGNCSPACADSAPTSASADTDTDIGNPNPNRRVVTAGDVVGVSVDLNTCELRCYLNNRRIMFSTGLTDNDPVVFRPQPSCGIERMVPFVSVQGKATLTLVEWQPP